MHELGVTFYVVDEVKKVAKENNISKVNSVTVSVGEVSTVIPELLIDCWDWCRKKEPVIENCEMKVEQIKASTFCEDCKQEYETVKYAKVCPYCGSENTYLVTGNEFVIKEIEVLDADRAAEAEKADGSQESASEEKTAETVKSSTGDAHGGMVVEEV